MKMIRNEENDRLAEEIPNINSESDIAKKPYRISVEFPLFLIMISSTLIGSVVSNIILYRTCVISLNFSHIECKGFLSPTKTNDTQHLEETVQKYATNVSMVKLVLESVAPAILSLFLGAWSSKYGRKPLITWSLLGMTLSTMLTVVYSMIPTLGPYWYIPTILPMSLTGGYMVLFTGSYSYISDISPSDRMTLRMTLIDATVSVGMVIGATIAKDLILIIGNVYLILCGTVLNVLAYSYASIFIPESLSGALEGGFSKILDIILVKEMARECFKKRPNNGRVQIFLLMAVGLISAITIYGISILEYMFTREKLHWAISDYNVYSAVGTAIGFTAGFLGLYIGQNLLNIRDIVFAIFTVVTKSAEFFIKSFAVASWQMYLASVVSMFKGLSGPLIRSYLLKIMPAKDIAQVFAMMCASEGLAPLIAPVVYTQIYRETISSFPGTFFLFSGAITAISAILLGFVKYYSYGNSRINYDLVTEHHDEE